MTELFKRQEKKSEVSQLREQQRFKNSSLGEDKG
jgi:hypothetical protein